MQKMMVVTTDIHLVPGGRWALGLLHRAYPEEGGAIVLVCWDLLVRDMEVPPSAIVETQIKYMISPYFGLTYRPQTDDYDLLVGDYTGPYELYA